MKNVITAISKNRKYLYDSLFSYLKENRYADCFLKPEEELSDIIKDFSGVLCRIAKKNKALDSTKITEHHEDDELYLFGIQKAEEYDRNGINFELSFTLLKYLRRAYNDLIRSSELNDEELEKAKRLIDNCFDRIELGFFQQWSKVNGNHNRIRSKEATKHLAREKNRHLLLLENLTDPVLLIDKYSTIIYYNKSAAILIRDNIIPSITFHDTDIKKISGWLLDYIKEYSVLSKPILFQRERRLKNFGKYFLIKMQKMDDSTLFNGEIYIILSEITYIKLAEENLKRYEDIIEQSPLSIMITDRDGKIEYVNPTFSRITGYNIDEVLHENPRFLNSGLKSEEDYSEFWDTILSGKDWKGIFRNKKKNGDFIWELTSISPLKNIDEDITSFVAWKEDITELKKAEEAVLDSERQFRSVWENSFNGMRLVDENGKIVRVNSAFCKMVEMPRELLEGKPVSISYFSEKRAEITERFKLNFSQKTIKDNFQKEMILWNGKLKWLEVTNSFIKVKEDNVFLLSVFKDITENKLNEQLILKSQNELKESEKKYRQLVETSHEGVIVIDENDKITYVNESMQRMINYKINELIGLSFYELIYDVDKTLFINKTEKRKQRVSEQYELRMLQKDSSVITTTFSSSPIIDDLGVYKGSLGIVSDITSKKIIENAMKYERHLFLSLMDSIPDFIYYKDMTGKFTRINISLSRYLGLKHPKEAVGKTDYDFFSKEVADIFADDERKVIQSGQGFFNKDEMNKLQDGRLRWLISTKIPLRDLSGNISGVFGISRDITDRKMMEKILWNEKEELNITLQNVGDGVITTNKDRRIILMNKKAEEITCFSHDEALNRDITEILLLYEKTGINSYLNPIRKLLAETGQDNLKGESFLITKQKNEILVNYNVSAIRDRDNEYAGFVIVFRDITKQKKIESQMMLSQKMESIGQLAAGISHEINTPMQYIGDNIVFLKESFEDIYCILDCMSKVMKSDEDISLFENCIFQLRKMREKVDLEYLRNEIPGAIDQSLTGVERVRNIVLAMKDFAHPGRKVKALNNINHGIEVTITISKNEWKYVADVETKLCPDLPLVFCSLDEINQVILNMIVNSAHSIKSKQEKGNNEKGKINIETAYDENDIIIHVYDDGEGIKEEIINKIFDPFFTTKEVGKGTGQGLAITHDIIVNKHGGNIAVDSTPGKGAHFIIRIPIINKQNGNGIDS